MTTRQPKGVPVGGQFSASARPESAVDLTAPEGPSRRVLAPGPAFVGEGAMYHFAPASAHDSLASDGLDWTRAPHADTPMIGYDDEADEEIELPRANYLYRTLDSARAGLPPGFHLYEVDVTGLDLHGDPYEDSEAALSIAPVTPDRLALHE